MKRTSKFTNSLSVILALVLISGYLPLPAQADTVIPNVCTTPDALGDTDKVLAQNLNNEGATLADKITALDSNIDPIGDQKNYQVWQMKAEAMTSVNVEYADGGAGGPIVFGYHPKDDSSSFVPIFKTGDYAGFESAPLLVLNESVVASIPNSSDIAFAIKSSDNGLPLFSTQTSQNPDGFRHAVVYDISDSNFYKSSILAFEDINGLGDLDYNDILVRVNIPKCGETTTPDPVTPPTVIGNNCVLPSQLGDTAKVTVGNFNNEAITLQHMIDAVESGIDVQNSQINYQSWNLSKASSTVEVTYLNFGAGDPILVGYHKKGDVNSFVPIFKTANYPDATTTPTLSQGEKVNVMIQNPGEIGFAIKSAGPSFASDYFISTENSLNYDGGVRHAVVYNASTTGSSLIGFEDYPGLGDQDYNDIVIKVAFPDCSSGTGTTTPPCTMNCGGGGGGSTTTPPTVIGNACVAPNQLASSTKIAIQNFNNEPITLQHMLNNAQAGINMQNDQINYQTWDLLKASSTIEVSYLDFGAGDPILFGYHKKGDKNSFTPVFKTSGYPNATSTPTLSKGQTISVNIQNTGEVAFAIKSAGPLFDSTYFISTENSQNYDGDIRHAVVYNASTAGNYFIGFEDLPNLGDIDFNDLFIKTSFQNCANVSTSTPNQPPTITLVGSNPLFLKVGDTFTDPGATAIDPEEGNITSKITVTGTVSTSAVSTTTLVYSVSDLQGLTATTSRLVIVQATTTPPCTVNCGGGGSTNHPPVITLVGANPITIKVGDTFTDPGATATDPEDGNLTPRIVVSGAVATSTVSTTTLTYSVTDNGGLSASTTRLVIVQATTTATTTPPCTTNCGGGGGTNPPCTVNCGGGGGSNLGGRRHPIVVGEVLGANTCYYLRDYIRIDWKNDEIEVLKLQSFLNIFANENLALTGVFERTTFDAVERFQNQYFSDILAPWGHDAPTGFVYILTKKKINEIYCNTPFPLTAEQLIEIAQFKAFLEGIKGGSSISVSDNINSTSTNVLENVSKNASSSVVIQLSKDSEGGGVVKNLAVSLFSLPEKIFGDSRYILLLLVLIAIAVAFIEWLASRSNRRAVIFPDEEIIIEDENEKDLV